ncbi:unnamed protein product [Closterium sp. NIES-53]
MTVSDLVTHLRSLDAGFRAACTDAQLLVSPPPHVAHCALTALGKIESNLLSVASATDAMPPRLFAGCAAPQLPTFTATRASAAVSVLEDTAAVSATDWQKRGKSGKKGGKGGGGGGGGGGGVGSGGGGGGGGGAPGGGSLGGGAGQTGPPTGGVQTGGGVGPQQQQPQQHQPRQRQQHQQGQQQAPQQFPPWGPPLQWGPQQHWGPPLHPCVCSRDDHSAARCFRRLDDFYRARWGPKATTPRWACLLARKIPVFDLSMDDAHVCLSSLGACVSALGACVASTPGIPKAVASLSFTLDSGASQCFFHDYTTLIPLLAPTSVALADPSSGPAVARSSTTLPCPVVPSGILRGLHISSFTRNLVSVGYLRDSGITVTFVGGGRTAVCTDAVTCRVLATFTREPRFGLYVLHTEHSLVSTSPQVAASPQVPAPPPVVESSQVSLASSRRSLPRLHPRALLASSAIFVPLRTPPPLVRPLLPSRHSTWMSGALHVRSDLRGSATFWWSLTTSPVTEGTRGRRVSCLHSDCGGEFRSGILAAFCGEQGIVQSWTLPESPQQNGVAERRIGLVMDIARMSMIHARAPHFLWPYAVRYAAHQLNLKPRVSWPEASPTSLWTGSPGVGPALLSVLLHPVPLLRSPCSPSPPFLAPSLPPAPAPPVPPPPPGPDPSGAATGGTRSRGARSRGAGVGGVGAGGDSSGGAGVGGLGTGGAWIGGAGAGDLDPVGTPFGDTGSGGASGLPVCVRGAGAVGAGAAGVAAVGLAGAAAAAAAATAAVAAAAATVAATAATAAAAAATAATTAPSRAAVVPAREWPPGPWSSLLSSRPLSSPPPVVSHYRFRPCPPSARPSSPVTDLHTALLCTSLRRSPPPVSVLSSPPPSSLPVPPTPLSDYYRAVRPVVSRILTTSNTDPRFSPSPVSALTAAVADFAATTRLDYNTRVVPSPPTCPLSVGGEFALGCDVLEDRHSELDFVAVASPSLCAMLLSPEGDPNALDIPNPRTYREVVSGPWASQ